MRQLAVIWGFAMLLLVGGCVMSQTDEPEPAFITGDFAAAQALAEKHGARLLVVVDQNPY